MGEFSVLAGHIAVKVAAKSRLQEWSPGRHKKPPSRSPPTSGFIFQAPGVPARKIRRRSWSNRFVRRRAYDKLPRRSTPKAALGERKRRAKRGPRTVSGIQSLVERHISRRCTCSESAAKFPLKVETRLERV